MRGARSRFVDARACGRIVTPGERDAQELEAPGSLAATSLTVSALHGSPQRPAQLQRMKVGALGHYLHRGESRMATGVRRLAA